MLISQPNNKRWRELKKKEEEEADDDQGRTKTGDWEKKKHFVRVRVNLEITSLRLDYREQWKENPDFARGR